MSDFTFLFLQSGNCTTAPPSSHRNVHILLLLMSEGGLAASEVDDLAASEGGGLAASSSEEDKDRLASSSSFSSSEGGPHLAPITLPASMQLSVFAAFEEWVDASSADVRATVYHFPSEEKLAALQRWLVSKNYDLAKVKEAVLEANSVRYFPRLQGFWPNETDALRDFPPLLFKKTLPFGFYGSTKKSGSPVLLFKLGRLELHSFETVLCSTQVIQQHWHFMTHAFSSECERTGCKDPALLVVVDLKGMGLSSLDEDLFTLLHELIRIDCICFPETLQNMIVLSPPAFLNLTWGAIRTWVDNCTAQKIELFKDRSKGLERLHALVRDVSQLPEEYGGSQLEPEDDANDETRRFELKHMRVSTCPTPVYITLAENECISSASIYSKCRTPSIFKGLLLRTPQHESDIRLRPNADRRSAFLTCGEDDTPYFAPRVVLGPKDIEPPAAAPPRAANRYRCGQIGGDPVERVMSSFSSSLASSQTTAVSSSSSSPARGERRERKGGGLNEDAICCRLESAEGEADGGIVLGPGIVTIEGRLKISSHGGGGGDDESGAAPLHAGKKEAVGLDDDDDDDDGGGGAAGGARKWSFFNAFLESGDWSERKPYVYGDFVVACEITKRSSSEDLLLPPAPPVPSNLSSASFFSREYTPMTLSDMINNVFDPPCYGEDLHYVVAASMEEGEESSAASGAPQGQPSQESRANNKVLLTKTTGRNEAKQQQGRKAQKHQQPVLKRANSV